jgi:ADP-ribosylation factor 2-binding protein
MSQFQEDEEEILVEHQSESKEDDEFERIITELENLLFDDKFTTTLNSFYDKNCDIFEDTAENKIEYTKIFQDYTKVVEDIIERNLTSTIPGFKMSRLEALVVSKKDELSGDVFDVLLSMSDFEEFKDLMVSQRHAKFKTSPFDFNVVGKSV